MNKFLFLALILFPLVINAQSIEISYMSGASASLYTQNRKVFSNFLEMKSTVRPFPNFVGEAAISYNFHKEKFKVTLAFNQLVYYYNLKTAFINPDFFSKTQTLSFSSGIGNNVISASFGPNIQIRPKIIFHPYISIYMGFNRGSSYSGGSQDILVPKTDSSISTGHIILEDRINFKTSVLLGIGYKFNFYVTKWLYLTVGSRYTRGFRKDFVATLSFDVDGEHYETQKFMRSSNFSVDLGLGAKINLKKKKK